MYFFFKGNLPGRVRNRLGCYKYILKIILGTGQNFVKNILKNY